MWLPGFGPRAAGTSGARGRGPGCWAIGGAIVVALMAGGLAGSFVASEWVVLVVTAAVAWVLIAWLRRRSHAGGSPSASTAASDEPVALTMADGTPIRDARGIASLGGTAADVAPEGEQMIWLDFVVEGDNIDTLVELLDLAPGYTGYRDGLLQPDGDRLIVNAMARLAADVVASGDEDVGAAPVGFVPQERWQPYAVLGRGMTLVQVAVMVNRDGTRAGRIGFRSSMTD